MFTTDQSITVNILQESFVHLAAEHEQIPSDLIFIYAGVSYTMQKYRWTIKQKYIIVIAAQSAFKPDRVKKGGFSVKKNLVHQSF